MVASVRAGIWAEMTLVSVLANRSCHLKASASITQGDFNGLRELANAAGKTFARGVVLYTGEQLMPFEEHLWAVPLGVLWAGGGGAA